MNAMNNNGQVSTTILDLDALLDTNLDSVESLPDYVTPPAGNYRLKVDDAKIESYKSKKEPNIEKKRFKIIYKVAKTYEVVQGQLPVADGSLFSETFMATEEGLKYFKKAAMAIMDCTEFGGAILKDVIEGLKGEEFDARITTRKTKGDDGAEFENINIKPMPKAAS